MLDPNKTYTIGTILREFNLPVCIQPMSWIGDFYFRIERTVGDRVEGTAFKNGKVYKRLGGNYTFQVSEYARLYKAEIQKYDKAVYDAEEFDASGYNRSGLDRYGYNRGGYDRDGYDRDGYDSDGFDKEGFDRGGFNKEGYDHDGYNAEGYNRQGIDREGNSLDAERNEEARIEHIAELYKSSGYEKGKTILYVRINGEWTTGTFVEFDNKKGHDQIYLEINGKRSFYGYPSLFVQDNITDLYKAKEKDKRIWGSYIPENIDAYNIAKSYKSYPISRRPDENYRKEMEYEVRYLSTVENKLYDLESEQNEKLSEARELKAKAKTRFEEAYIIDRESDTGYDPFNPAFLEAESYTEKSESLTKNAEKEKRKIEKAKLEPYFARIDCGSSNIGLHTVYLGNFRIGNLVVNWRNSSVGNAYYYSDMLKNTEELTLALKRIFTFSEGMLKSFKDEINTYSELAPENSEEKGLALTDSLFLTLLQESRNEETIHNIVRTIQQNQYRIITSVFDRNIIVNGCAGSGKTMILYHRLSYMAYNDPVNFIPENVFAVTPSKLFISLSNELVESLQLTEINNLTFLETVHVIINRYKNRFRMVTLDFFWDNIDDKGRNQKEFLNTESYKKFRDKLLSVCTDYTEFTDWLLERINEKLAKYEIRKIEVSEYYKCLFRRSGLSDLIGTRIRETFDSVTKRVKNVKDRNGHEVEIEEKVVDNYCELCKVL